MADQRLDQNRGILKHASLAKRISRGIEGRHAKESQRSSPISQGTSPPMNKSILDRSLQLKDTI